MGSTFNTLVAIRGARQSTGGSGLMKQHKRWVLCAALLTGASVTSPMVQADITFEERGERFSVDVRDEPIAEVMDTMAERFNFTVDGYPEHWSDEPMSFSATGDLERVLSALLKDTSHVFEYHTDLDTRETRIASLKLLNEGTEGIFTRQTNRVPDSPRDSSAPTYRSGSLSANQEGNGTRTLGQRLDGSEDLPSAADGANRNARNVASVSGGSGASGLSQSLEARARQSNPETAAAPASSPPATPVVPGEPSAEMRALTQKALKDVQGLAEALKKAEGK